MTRHAKLPQNLIALLITIIPALAFLCLQPSTARADSITLLAQYLGNSSTLCLSFTNPANCGVAQATASLANGTIGASAGFPQGGLPLPSFSGQTTDEAIASAALLYNFTSSVSSGTAVINLDVSGNSSVSTNAIPNSICPPSTPCRAAAEIGIVSGESFVGAPSGTTEDILANIFNSGSASAPSGPIQIVVPISGGLTNLSFSLTTLAECPSLTALQMSEGISCSAIADYLDPLTITSASIYNTNGNLVYGATLVSQSGFSLTSAATPEPSSIFLFGTGISLLGLATQDYATGEHRSKDLSYPHCNRSWCATRTRWSSPTVSTIRRYKYVHCDSLGGTT